jgi:hypothetical protein
MDTKTVGCCASAFSLPAFQKKEHFEASLNLRILLGPNLGIEPVDRLVHFGEVVHGGK